MVDFAPGNLIDGGKFHRDRNEETRLTVVSEHNEVARPPLHHRGAHSLAFSLSHL